MMVAMMVPSLVPAVRTFDTWAHSTGLSGGATVLFVTWYLLVWSAIGAVAYLHSASAPRLASGGEYGGATSGRRAAGRCRCVSADAAQAGVFAPVPVTTRGRGPAGGHARAGAPGRGVCGTGARAVLPGIQLAADAGAPPGRADESYRTRCRRWAEPFWRALWAYPQQPSGFHPVARSTTRAIACTTFGPMGITRPTRSPARGRLLPR
jgi:hypothetical protein